MRPEFPAELEENKHEIENLVSRCGLDFYPTIFEIVDFEEMSSLSVYGGYPVRYHLWLFGQEFLKMKKFYRHNLAVIYELVIPTNPTYAYLLNANSRTKQKLVMAHVYGHNNFFKNNIFFKDFPPNLHDIFADNARRIDYLQSKLGKFKVDQFLEDCLSLFNLFNLYEPLNGKDKELRELNEEPRRIIPSEKLPEYMDEYLNPPEYLEKERERIKKEKELRSQIELGIKTPAASTRDIFGFLLEHATLEKWQKEVMRIVREESWFTWRAGLTKIMNEGWASFWHCRLMAEEGAATDAEVCSFARAHAGVMGPSHSFDLNPYRLGLQLWEDIQWRWDTGRHGQIWTECKERSISEHWEEFIVFKSLRDKYGGLSDGFKKEWQEFSVFLNEMKNDRGPVRQAFFTDAHKVTEWLKYQTDERYAKMRELIRGGEIKSEPISIPPEWLDWAQKHSLVSPLGAGLAKMFAVRDSYDDVNFINDFFTKDFCKKHRYFIYGPGLVKGLPEWFNRLTIKSLDHERIKKFIIQRILNVGQPKVVLYDANFCRNGELRFIHLHDGRDLDIPMIYRVLRRIYQLWGRGKPVHLETFLTQYPERRPWFEDWAPRGRKRRSRGPIRLWTRYSYNGKDSKDQRSTIISWDNISQDILDLLPVFT